MPRIIDYPLHHRTGGLTSRDAVYWAARDAPALGQAAQ